MKKTMFHIGTVLVTALAITLTLGSLGCESRFVESSPASVDLEGTPLEERLSEKAKVDAKVKEVQEGADKAKRIIDLFRKVQNPSDKENAYTPLDFLIDLNNELKMKIPEKYNNSLIRKAQLLLPANLTSEDCKTVDATLTKTELFEDSFSQTAPVGERLTYSIKPCGSTQDYVPAVEADWIGSKFEFRLLNKNLESIFQNQLNKELADNSYCRISQNESKIIDFIQCENFNAKISVSEIAVIKTMSFSNKGEIRFEATADIFENNLKKAQSTLKVSRHNDVDFKVKKLSSSDQEAP